MSYTPKLIVVVGTPGSGKDILIRAVNDLGTQHAEVVPKHSSRTVRRDEGDEMIFQGDKDYALNDCDIVYENYGDKYGIECSRIWEGLRRGVFQVLVVSNLEAINKLKMIFGSLLILVYVHSQIDPEKYKEKEAKFGDEKGYIEQRAEQYRMAFDMYLTNYLAFNHVLIYAGAEEDLFDQIFRLFRAYEKNYF